MQKKWKDSDSEKEMLLLFIPIWKEENNKKLQAIVSE